MYGSTAVYASDARSATSGAHLLGVDREGTQRRECVGSTGIPRNPHSRHRIDRLAQRSVETKRDVARRHQSGAVPLSPTPDVSACAPPPTRQPPFVYTRNQDGVLRDAGKAVLPSMGGHPAGDTTEDEMEERDTGGVRVAFQSAQWHRTRRLQLSLVRTSLILMTCLTVGLVVVIAWPVRDALYRRVTNEFDARGRLVLAEVQGFVDQSMQLAMQVPSRTLIRQELVAYLNGERTLEWYVGFTRPKLEDAVAAAEGMVGVFRYDPGGRPIVGTFADPDMLPEVDVDHPQPMLVPSVCSAAGTPALVFQVPIVHPGFGLAGFDIVALSTDALATSLSAQSDGVGGARIELDLTDADCDDPIVVEDGRYEGDRGPFHIVTFEIPEALSLSVAIPARELFALVRRDLQLFFAVVAVLGLLSIAIAAIVLGILSRRTMLETGELSRIVDEQTQQLQLLLREVHHRVKNDVQLMNAFLMLRATDTESVEVRTALEEAGESLEVMGRVYGLLHQTGDYGHVQMKTVVDGLIAQTKKMASGAALSIHSDVDDRLVARRLAIPIGIVANELLTNVAKYGAGGDPRRPVSTWISFKTISDSSLRLTVADDGEAFPDQVIAGEYGFGLKMVALLTEQFGGTLTITKKPRPTVSATFATSEEETIGV